MPSANIHEKWCESCRKKLTHKTCAICRKYRKVAHLTEDGKSLCRACGPGVAQKHSCPDCGSDVPGSGKSRCRICLNRTLLLREVELNTIVLTRNWMRVLYRNFATWLFERQGDRPNLTKVFRSHHIFFERLDTQLVNLSELTADLLLQIFGTAGLRKHLLATQFLNDSLAIELSAEKKAESADLERIRNKLRENKKQPWGKILDEYAESLVCDGLPVRTRRLYLATAASFCQFAKLSTTAWPEETARVFLVKKPGLRANLSKFVAYCSRAYGWNATMPRRNDVRLKRKGVPKTVSYLRDYLQKISMVGIAKVDQTILIRVIARSLGFPIRTISEMSVHQFKIKDKNIVISVQGESVVIPSQLNDIVREFFDRIVE
jgi:hypothetical protein